MTLTSTGAPSSTHLRSDVGRSPLSFYVHVPFCARRCGYCAFVTSAPGEVVGPTGEVPGEWTARHRLWADAAAAEVGLAAERLGSDVPPIGSIYFGGGTPTAVDASLIVGVLEAIGRNFELVDDIEVTVEANPDGLATGQLDRLVDGGVTRISFGMQSTSESALRTLDRTHPGTLAPAAVSAARLAGAAHVSLDLIYGTPGETDDEWAASVRTALSCDVDHISAYSLSVEPRTRLAARIRTGQLPHPDPDSAARRYRIADEACQEAGFEWYELSNWAAEPAARCRHNLGTWRDHDWWGIGPGAHSHVGRQRWWNHSSERTWAGDVRSGGVPAAGHEVLDEDSRRCERIMLGIRLREGLAIDERMDPAVLEELASSGLIGLIPTAGPPGAELIVLTAQGRLVADHVVRSLL